MAPFALKLEKTAPQTEISVSLESASNGFVSLMLAAKNDQDPGIHDWVQKFLAEISSEERARHTLVMIGFFYAILPEKRHESFPAYIDYIESQPASRLRERLLNAYAGICLTEPKPEGIPASVKWDEVLASATSYTDFLKSRFTAENVDMDLETRAYEYVIDPAAMKQLIVDHLRWAWKNYLEPEWNRVRPMLEESVRAFQKVDMSSMSRLEAARFITGQELEESKWAEGLGKAEKVFFIPNAHLGPYLQRIHSENAILIFFGARQPETAKERIPELDRAEIVARLSALADDTRLNILQMIAERGEMRVPEIIDATGLSQPSVSRYLIQLTATGYLKERRTNGAKVYTLNRERIEKTLKAVSAFLLGRS
jgi:DNA-binding transcriptional ArsR family regulator